MGHSAIEKLLRDIFQLDRDALFGDDLGDIAAFIDPSCAPWEKTGCPSVGEGLKYDFTKTTGDIVRIKDVARDRCFDLLEEALRRLKP